MGLPDHIPPKAGRPPYIVKHPEAQDQIIEVLKEGATYRAAAQAAGMAHRTLTRTLQHGRRARALLEEEGEEALGFWDPYYLDFLERVEQAEVEIQRNLLKQIREDPSWTSAAWILERRYGYVKPSERAAMQMSGQDTDNFTLDIGEPAHQIEGEAKEADYEIVEDDDEDGES